MFKIDWQLFSTSRISFDGDSVWLYVRRLGSFNEVPLFYQEQVTLGLDGV